MRQPAAPQDSVLARLPHRFVIVSLRSDAPSAARPESGWLNHSSPLSRSLSDTTTGGKLMDEPYNGMPAAALDRLNWLKSQHSNPSGNCVEMACLPSGQIAVRNSRHPAGPVLYFTPAEIAAFLQGAKDGEFDRILQLDSGRGSGRAAMGDRRQICHDGPNEATVPVLPMAGPIPR
jgi:hypothetical protein